jgi:hypothetical protein
VEPPSDPIQEGSLERGSLVLAFAFTKFFQELELLIVFTSRKRFELLFLGIYNVQSMLEDCVARGGGKFLRTVA